jgi:hypothetical protein
MGNFTKDPAQELTSALTRDYVRVRFQQGKPVLDRDLNLAADLASPQRLASVYLGQGVAGTGADFAVAGLDVPNNDFTITPGRLLVNGLEAVLRAPTTYRTQPTRTSVAPLPAGSSNVYLRVFEREVAAAEDPLLGNPDDVQFETGVRTKADWEVIVSAAIINQPTHHLLAVITTTPAPSVQDRRRVGLNLAAAADEVRSARGTAANLSARLNVAHAASGALANSAVGTAQIAAGAVSIAQLKRTVRFSGTITVPAATEVAVNAFVGPGGTANRHAVLLASVIASGGAAVVSWREFASQQVVAGVAQFTRGIRIRHEGGVALTVDVEIVELSPT